MLAPRLWNTQTIIFFKVHTWIETSLVAQLVKNPPAMPGTWVWSLGWENPLEKGTATHSSILAWRIPWTVVHRVTELDWTEWLSHGNIKFQYDFIQKKILSVYLVLGMVQTSVITLGDEMELVSEQVYRRHRHINDYSVKHQIPYNNLQVFV